MPGPGWADLAAEQVGFFAEGAKVDILSRSTLSEVALGVPAVFTSSTFEQQALEGAAVTMTVATADLGNVVLNGSKSVRLPGGAVYPFTPVSAAGVLPPTGLPGAAMTVVSGFIQAGDDGAPA